MTRVVMHSLFSASAEDKRLRVSEETEKTMRVTWTPAPGKPLNYQLKYVPHEGGKEVVQKIPAKVTSTVMRNLKPVTTYSITVLPVYKRREGKARQGLGTTRTLVHNSTLRDSTLQTHTSQFKPVLSLKVSLVER